MDTRESPWHPLPMPSHPYCDPIPEGHSPFHRLTRAVWLVCAVGTVNRLTQGWPGVTSRSPRLPRTGFWLELGLRFRVC